MNFYIAFTLVTLTCSIPLSENDEKSPATMILKEVIEENHDKMKDYVHQTVKEVLGSTNNEDQEIKEELAESISDEEKKKIFLQTELEEKVGETAPGVNIKVAVKGFERKMKQMVSEEITNAETFIEKQEDTLAEQKAEDVNKQINIIEGDIIRTEEVDAVMNNKTDKRNLYTGVKWGLIVPYQLPVEISGGGVMERAINEAMRELSSLSCIKFVKRKNDGTSDDNVDVNGQPETYLRFIQGNGCYSFVGNQQKRGQDVSIGTNCERKGIVMHEILHTLGFYHEQSRLDRDDYVTINFENIIDGHAKDFKKYENGQADTLGFGYDYGSIMHYGDYFFSKNRQKTIEVLSKNNIAIGQREALSEIDKQKLNKLYCSPQNQEEYKRLQEKGFARMMKNVYAPY